MAVLLRTRLCFCLLLLFAVVCSARNTIFLSDEETVFAQVEGRSLKISLNDYSGASANNVHSPGKASSSPAPRPKVKKP